MQMQILRDGEAVEVAAETQVRQVTELEYENCPCGGRRIKGQAPVSETPPARDDVLEEAAQVCERQQEGIRTAYGHESVSHAMKEMGRIRHEALDGAAQAIRALKNAAPQGGDGYVGRAGSTPAGIPAVAAPVCVGVARREWGEGPDGDKDVIAFINENHLLQSLLYDLDLLPEQHMKAPRDGKAWCTIFNITNHFREAVLAARQSERNESR